ncbi:hypothetical protein [Gynurincola endophyticus]|uniref:hypothetical protein n=1 Tax=Gynurincola endophyticus TaxID=2479004 RepID=UPI000F8F3E58|nr:hypothetical protein [Gynurincola endophyticus]
MTLKWISNISNKRIDGTGIGLFRFFYGIILFCEVLQLYKFRNLIFDVIPFVKPYEISFTVPIILWLITLIFLIAGFKTRIAAIVNYVFSICIISSISTFEYHMFYAYMGINFLLVFLTVDRNLAVDAIFYRLKNHNLESSIKISPINHFVVIFVGVALVYFDSIFYKTSSRLWMNGLGVWLPSSLPHISTKNLYWLLNSKFLMLFLGYLTLLFEFVFIFTFFRKKWRPALFLIGVGLHIGITIFYPIPWFGLGVCAIYFCLMPTSWINYVRTKFSSKNKIKLLIDDSYKSRNIRLLILSIDVFQKFEFEEVDTIRNASEYYTNVFSAYWYTKIFGFLMKYRWVDQLLSKDYFYNQSFADSTAPFTVWRIRTIQLFLLFVIFLQICSTLYSPSMVNAYAKMNIETNKVLEKVLAKSYAIQKLSKQFLGITYHGVFMDVHFDDYNHVIAVEYEDKNGKQWLPIINYDGSPGSYLNGSTWIKWTFRSNNPHVDTEVLSNSLKRFTSYWLYQNGKNTENAHFNIKVKVIDTIVDWEKDFLKNQREKEWVDGGSVMWIKDEFIDHIKDIESIQ